MGVDCKPKVFMIMPFSEDFEALFVELQSRFAEKYEFTNAGDMDNQQSIIRSIVEGLINADVVIADLTNRNANVFYELGLAHALNKKVIIITQSIDELPFDIKAYRAFEYSLLFYKMPKLIEELTQRLDGAISGKMKYGSPISDFAPSNVTTSLKEEEKTANSEEEGEKTGVSEKTDTSKENGEKPVDAQTENEETGDMGFLDYSAEFHESTEEIVTSIESIGTDLDAMSKSVGEANRDLNRAKTNSKTLNPAFVRNLARRLAAPINDFACKLNANTTTISSRWGIAENCYLSMLDDPHIQTPENIAGVKTSIDSLYSMQQAIDTSNGQVEDFENSLRSCLGLERQLNKALNATINELDQYLSITDSMKSSIDRMISRSNLAIEQWDANHKEES
jgi:hypothetical protein